MSLSSDPGPATIEMAKIYTRTGDGGKTRLFDRSEVSKDDLRVMAYGDVDELNAHLGAAAAHVDDEDVRRLLEEVQSQLMALGAQLADPRTPHPSGKGSLETGWVQDLEAEIDRYDGELPLLKKFILSGGGSAGAWLHVSRTVCRRAERSVVRLSNTVSLDQTVIEYLNRLSDLLFVLARVVNLREGRGEIQW